MKYAPYIGFLAIILVMAFFWNKSCNKAEVTQFQKDSINAENVQLIADNKNLLKANLDSQKEYRAHLKIANDTIAKKDTIINNYRKQIHELSISVSGLLKNAKHLADSSNDTDLQHIVDSLQMQYNSFQGLYALLNASQDAKDSVYQDQLKRDQSRINEQDSTIHLLQHQFEVAQTQIMWWKKIAEDAMKSKNKQKLIAALKSIGIAIAAVAAGIVIGGAK